jgi:hypothetical protein
MRSEKRAWSDRFPPQHPELKFTTTLERLGRCKTALTNPKSKPTLTDEICHFEDQQEVRTISNSTHSTRLSPNREVDEREDQVAEKLAYKGEGI